MADNSSSKRHLVKVHLVGGLCCALIAGSSIYFAGNAITKRRGLFLSARHELVSTKSLLSDSLIERTALTTQVRALEYATEDQIELVSVNRLNGRTAEIVALAESVDIRIDSLQPGKQIVDKRVPVLPMALVGSANADDVFAFLGLLGDQMPDIHIQELDLVSGSLESSVVQIDMQMYWFIDPASGN